jgi:hypothetical protein
MEDINDDIIGIVLALGILFSSCIIYECNYHYILV